MQAQHSAAAKALQNAHECLPSPALDLELQQSIIELMHSLQQRSDLEDADPLGEKVIFSFVAYW